MVRGEIKVVRVQTSPTTWVPAIRVCDGQKTATKLFGVQILDSEWYGTIPGPPHGNGDLRRAGHRVNGVFKYYQLVIGLNGEWYRTTESWEDSAVMSGGVDGEIYVIHNSKTGLLPVIVVLGNSGGHWWCPTGWVQN